MNPFFWYFLVAFSITIVQLFLEYKNEKDRTFASVIDLVETVNSSLSSALWEVDEKLLEKTLNSMVLKPFVGGAVGNAEFIEFVENGFVDLPSPWIQYTTSFYLAV